MKSILNSAACRAVLALLTIKNIKTNFGHDLAGLGCKVYIGKKYMGQYDDDGFGGEAEFHEAFEGAQAEVTKLLRDNDFAQLMWDNGWQFGDSVDKMEDKLVFDCAMEEACNMVIIQRDYARVAKKSIVYGVPFGDGYRYMSYKRPLVDVSKAEQGRTSLIETVQKVIDTKLGKGEMILNNNLDSLGLDLSAKVKAKILV